MTPKQLQDARDLLKLAQSLGMPIEEMEMGNGVELVIYTGMTYTSALDYGDPNKAVEA